MRLKRVRCTFDGVVVEDGVVALACENGLGVHRLGPLPASELAAAIDLAIHAFGRHVRIEFEREPQDVDVESIGQALDGVRKTLLADVAPGADEV